MKNGNVTIGEFIGTVALMATAIALAAAFCAATPAQLSGEADFTAEVR